MLLHLARCVHCGRVLIVVFIAITTVVALQLFHLLKEQKAIGSARLLTNLKFCNEEKLRSKSNGELKFNIATYLVFGNFFYLALAVLLLVQDDWTEVYEGNSRTCSTSGRTRCDRNAWS